MAGTRNTPAAATVSAALVLAGGAFVALVTGPAPHESLLVTMFTLVAAAIVYFDIAALRAPNALTYPAMAGGLMVVAPLGIEAFTQAAAGGLIVALFLGIAALASRGAMGMGDAKFGAVCGIAVGAQGLAIFLMTTFLAAVMFSAIVLSLRLRDRDDVFPFTPFLVAGAFTAFLLSAAVVTA